MPNLTRFTSLESRSSTEVIVKNHYFHFSHFDLPANVLKKWMHSSFFSFCRKYYFLSRLIFSTSQRCFLNPFFPRALPLSLSGENVNFMLLEWSHLSAPPFFFYNTTYCKLILFFSIKNYWNWKSESYFSTFGAVTRIFWLISILTTARVPQRVSLGLLRLLAYHSNWLRLCNLSRHLVAYYFESFGR